MKKCLILVYASLVGLSACSEKEATKAPISTNWLNTAIKTSDGGIRLGNPAAKVKLVIYSAFSCTACATFSTNSGLALKNYVATGKVNYEFRNYKNDVTDLPTTLIARCGDPTKFFPIADQLFLSQPEWRGSVEKPGALDDTDVANFPPDLLSSVLAAKLGLYSFAAKHGLDKTQVGKCLSDKASLAELDQVTVTARTRYAVSELPAFLINGQRVDGTPAWSTLELALKKAGATD